MELQTFNNNNFGSIRGTEINGVPYLVGKDVAEALGYANPQKAIRDHVDDEDKGVNEMVTPGGRQQIVVINESGLYSLVFSSHLPKAKQFKHWVTSEVLPSIRKHGMYASTDTIEQLLNDPDTMIKTLQALKLEREKRKELETQNAIMKPKAIFADAVSQSHNCILVGELAKILKQNGIKIGQNRLFDWLRTNGYLISRKGSDYNMPTQRSMELGVFTIKETAITHADGHVSVTRTPKVTGKGQVYFINKFNKFKQECEGE